MNRRMKTGVVLATVGAMSIAGTLAARAGWIIPAEAGRVTARAATMPAGGTPDATVQKGNAVVSWSAQEIVPGVPMTAYTVIGHASGPTPPPEVVHTVPATGAAIQSTVFPGTELAGGTWTWSIVPRLDTWTGREGRPSSPKLTFAEAPATLPANGSRTTGTAGSGPMLPDVESTGTGDQPGVDGGDPADSPAARPAATPDSGPTTTPAGAAATPHGGSNATPQAGLTPTPHGEPTPTSQGGAASRPPNAASTPTAPSPGTTGSTSPTTGAAPAAIADGADSPDGPHSAATWE